MKKDRYDLNDLPDELIKGEYSDYLTEEDFYPPSDNRTWKSYVKDIDGGDNFIDYCKYIFEVLEEEGYYE